jgi:hypothetical protein
MKKRLNNNYVIESLNNDLKRKQERLEVINTFIADYTSQWVEVEKEIIELQEAIQIQKLYSIEYEVY